MLQLKNTTFGIPNTKELKAISKEPYADEAVFILHALDTTKTKVLGKMMFNTTGMKTLGIETTESTPKPTVIFISNSQGVYIMKGLDVSNDTNLLVNKKGSINNKDYYNFIVERFGLNTEQDNYFRLIPIEAEGENNEIITVYQLQNVLDVVEETVMDIPELEETVVKELVINV